MSTCPSLDSKVFAKLEEFSSMKRRQCFAIKDNTLHTQKLAAGYWLIMNFS